MSIKDLIVGKLANKRVNIFWTLFFNFTCLPFRLAIQLPIICYGKMRVLSLGGNIIINDTIKKGMIKIGADVAHYRTASITTISIHKGANIVFHGPFVVSQGASIVVGPNAKLSLGAYSGMGEYAEIICMKNISIGEHTDITWQSQITDTGTHNILNKTTNCVSSIYKPVRIGSYCWICNRTTIQPGVVIPDRVIVGSNSLVNKSFENIAEGSLIAGIPAKYIKGDVYRIYDKDEEVKLMEFFRFNDTAQYEYNK